ncbi:TlpA family protein disulfide reductase [Mariniflexile sp.]|uniref:TlpA family protein disulfide reductase n=1 Tax=Mariniflexile sp. TaxID=1979402 RepID=UPI0035638FA0
MKTLPTKNTVFIFLLALMLTSCQSPGFISGKIEGVKNKEVKIYLIQPETLQEVGASYFGKVIDSAIIKPDGNFKFGNIPSSAEPVLLEIAIQPTKHYPNYLQTDNPTTSNYMPIVWKSGDELKIKARLDDFQKSISIENASSTNLELLKLRDINLKAYQTFLEGKHWELEDGKQLLEKEHALLNYQTELIKFSDSTLHLLPALVALRWVSPVNNYERIPEYLVRQCHKWQKEKQNNNWVNELCEQSEPTKLPVLVGDLFPDLQLPTITKDTISIKNELGSKLTIIDLWASWCGPCRKENREVLAPLWNEYHKKGLQIIAYGLESDETTWKKAVEQDGAHLWFQTSDLLGDDTPVLKKIRVQTIPANFILNDNGIVIAKNIHGKDLIEWIKNYMSNN